MKKDNPLFAYGLYGAVGFQLASLVVAGLVLGHLVDVRWGTSPWLTLLGLVLGATGGFYNLVRILSWKSNRDE